MKKHLFLLLFLLFISLLSYAQSIVYVENITKSKKINYQINENKVLLVFESSMDLEFESSMENLALPEKKGNLYYLFLGNRTCVITIRAKKYATLVNIPFGQLTENSYPTLKQNEIRYFEIGVEDKLLCLENTTQQKAEGANDYQMLFEKEDLLIFNIDPIDLDLTFNSTEIITEVKKSGNRYLLYIMPKAQTITISDKNSKAKNVIQIPDAISSKQVLYYFISLPEYLRKKENAVFDNKIAIGSYFIDSKPEGAIIEIFGNPAFNSQKNKTPFYFKDYEAGPKIITIKLDDYENLTDTINIGSRKTNKSVYKLVPEFAYLNFDISPAPPYSKIKIDGDNLLYVTNNKDIKILKGDKKIEINAEHFYSENIILSAISGKTHPVKIRLKPKMGKLLLTADKNSEGATVFIDNERLGITKKDIGILPFTVPVEIQEGEYILQIKKSGYASSNNEMKISISENETTSLNINMVSTKEIKISTIPSGAAVYIDGQYVKLSNFTAKIGIGSHTIKIEKENYETKVDNIYISEDKKDGLFQYILTPILKSVNFHTSPTSITLNIDDNNLSST